LIFKNIFLFHFFKKNTEKLGIEVDTVKNGVEGLSYLFLESSKLVINEIDFYDSLMLLGFQKPLIQLLFKVKLINNTF